MYIKDSSLLVQVLDCDEQQATEAGSIFPSTVFASFAAAGKHNRTYIHIYIYTYIHT